MSYPTFKARWVMGSPTELRKTDHENKPLDENKHHWFIGFAVPKGADWDALWNHMYQTAANDPSCTAALCGQAGFGWKTDDCDAPENPANLGKSSYPAGHMLIKFTRNVKMGPMTIVDGNFQAIVNPTAIKRGDYFFVSASTKFNGASTVKTNAGMYQNIDGIMFAGAGEEIVGEGGFDAQTAFAGFQGATVQGGSIAPTPNTPVASAPPAATPPAQAPAAPVTPAHDLVAPQVPGNATPPPSAPSAPVEPKYTYNGVTHTKAEWLAMPGWTEEILLANATEA